MRSKELDDVDKLLQRLLTSKGSRLVHNPYLRAAQREIRKANRGGEKDNWRRIVLAMQMISIVLVEDVLTEAARR
jgi:hypothetical protein